MKKHKNKVVSVILILFLIVIGMLLCFCGCSREEETQTCSDDITNTQTDSGNNAIEITIDFGDNTEDARNVLNFANDNAQKWIGKEVVELSEIVDIYPFRYFKETSSRLIEKYDDGVALHEMLMVDDQLWAVITETNQIITVRQKDNDFEIAEIRTKGPINDSYDKIVDKNAVIEEINRSQISQIDGVYIATDFRPLTCVIVVSGGDEYVIPFCSRPDFSHLENGKLYTAKEAIDTLREWFLPPLLPEE